MNLSALQSAVSAALALDAQLVAASVVCLAQNKRDIVGEINERVAKIGICALALTPSHAAEGASSCGPFGTLSVAVRVIENPVVNRRRAVHLTAIDAAEHIGCILHMVSFSEASSPLAYASIAEAPVEGAIAYDVTFTCKSQLIPHSDP